MLRSILTGLLPSLFLSWAAPAGAGPFSYTTNAGSLTITGYTGPGGDVVIPALIDNLPVSAIETGAFSNLATLASITVPGGVTNLGTSAFSACSNLTGAYFAGNAPAADSTTFEMDRLTTVYYLPGTTGWMSLFAGLATMPWSPAIQRGDANFGVQGNQFGFDIAGPTNSLASVLACTNLATPVWTPLQNLTLTNGLAHFSDPLPATGPGRYYGLGFPASNPPSQPVPVLRWKLDEGSGTNVADSSGHGHGGTLQGSPLPAWVVGPDGVTTNALAFADNGTNGVQGGTGMATGSNDVTQLNAAQHATLSLWINENSRQFFGGGLANCKTPGYDPQKWNFSLSNAGDEGVVYAAVSNGENNTMSYFLPILGWHHQCITFDGSQALAADRVRYYVDGVNYAPLIQSVVGNPTNLPTADVLGVPTLGYNAYDGYVSGGVSDMQIFDVTLTPAQVAAIYAAGAQ